MFGVVAPLCLLTGLLLVAQEVVKTANVDNKWTKTEKLEENFCLAKKCMPTCVDEDGNIIEGGGGKVKIDECVCNALNSLAADEDGEFKCPAKEPRQIKNHRYKRSMAPNKSANRHIKGTYCVVAASLFLMIAFQCLTPHL